MALAGLSEPTHLPCSLEAVQLGPCSGLLVDWLEMLDPEVISSCPNLQQRLLFSRSKVGLSVVGLGPAWCSQCRRQPPPPKPCVC